MNIEENRLQTFNEWPTDAVVSPMRIAKAGFYSTNDSLTVECFSCQCRITEWNYGDQVMARHRLLSPQCPFVLNPATSGNVPNVPTQSTSGEPQQSSTSPESMTDEAVRLRTFTNWPVPAIVSPERLSRAGFYSLQYDDKVKCSFCGGVVGCWETGDDPDLEHRRHFPRCPYVVSHIVPRLEERSHAQTVTDHKTNNMIVVSRQNLQELGVQAHRVPRHAKYSTLESRIRSFVGWPDDLIQRPDVLAQTGFFYVGGGDQVRCYHCDGGLRHWDPEDDPWVEHARWFPRCGFVQLVKGQDFIQMCMPECSSSGGVVPTSRNRSAPFSRVREVADADVQALMTTPAVLAALNVGLHVGRVKKALRYKLEQTGIAFNSPDALIEAALNMQLEEDEIPNDALEEQISRGVTRQLSRALEHVRSAPQAQEEDLSLNCTRSSNNVSETDNNARNNSSVGSRERGEARTTNPQSLEEENRLLKEARLCKICLDSEVGIVFLPCGHLATCVNCAPSLKDCPVCRAAIKATVRTFLS